MLGIGNILLRDEGIGIRVIEELKKYPLPDNVELFDGGTRGADLLDIISGRQKVIIIDAIDGNYEPGTVVCFTLNDLEKSDEFCINSLHNINIPETIAMTRLLGVAPKDIVVVGIQFKSIECGTELSDEVASAIPASVKFIQHRF